jgi:hypothetical protein
MRKDTFALTAGIQTCVIRYGIDHCPYELIGADPDTRVFALLYDASDLDNPIDGVFRDGWIDEFGGIALKPMAPLKSMPRSEEEVVELAELVWMFWDELWVKAESLGYQRYIGMRSDYGREILESDDEFPQKASLDGKAA